MSDAGKGDTPRKVDRESFSRTMLRLYGVRCPECGGDGIIDDAPALDDTCKWCNGAGLIESWVHKRWLAQGEFL